MLRANRYWEPAGGVPQPQKRGCVFQPRGVAVDFEGQYFQFRDVAAGSIKCQSKENEPHSHDSVGAAEAVGEGCPHCLEPQARFHPEGIRLPICLRNRSMNNGVGSAAPRFHMSKYFKIFLAFLEQK